ncbi:MAG: hypothetical protein Q8K96_05300 [Rubrivivax sp.]|nr:hypothetical protein [Rubrivivax sp.]
MRRSIEATAFAVLPLDPVNLQVRLRQAQGFISALVLDQSPSSWVLHRRPWPEPQAVRGLARGDSPP